MVFDELSKTAARGNKPIEKIVRRGDSEATRAARQFGRLVLSHADYVGGLEFSGAILVGVDDGRIPPSRPNMLQESKSYLAYASHNQLYVALTRARYQIEVLGEAGRGPSDLLKSAIDAKIIDLVYE